MRFAELVFHVLAHVRKTAHLAPSLWDPAWVALVERTAGPADARTLAEDARLLGAAATHDSLARLQLLAWLFDDVERAVACADRPLTAVRREEVDAPDLLPMLTSANGTPPLHPLVEILRAAAELEADVLAALPPVEAAAPVTDVARAAPFLASCTVTSIRSLRLRGRVLGRAIWIGAPCLRDGPSAEHVAWQAAHEASVAEVSQSARARGLAVAHAPLEHAALVLLAERARREGLRDRHARWLAHLHAPPTLVLDDVPEPFRALVAQTLASSTSAR